MKPFHEDPLWFQALVSTAGFKRGARTPARVISPLRVGGGGDGDPRERELRGRVHAADDQPRHEVVLHGGGRCSKAFLGLYALFIYFFFVYMLHLYTFFLSFVFWVYDFFSFWVYDFLSFIFWVYDFCLLSFGFITFYLLSFGFMTSCKPLGFNLSPDIKM